MCHGGGFSASRDSEQCLVRKALVESLDELFDGLRLIAGGLERSLEFERNLLFHASSHASVSAAVAARRIAIFEWRICAAGPRRTQASPARRERGEKRSNP